MSPQAPDLNRYCVNSGDDELNQLSANTFGERLNATDVQLYVEVPPNSFNTARSTKRMFRNSL